MEQEPMVKLSRYLELERRWVRSEEPRRKLIDALVDLVDKNFFWADGYLDQDQISKSDIVSARKVLIEVTDGTLKDDDKERPFYKGVN